jgi:hypothetical protein
LEIRKGFDNMTTWNSYTAVQGNGLLPGPITVATLATAHQMGMIVIVIGNPLPLILKYPGKKSHGGTSTATKKVDDLDDDDDLNVVLTWEELNQIDKSAVRSYKCDLRGHFSPDCKLQQKAGKLLFPKESIIRDQSPFPLCGPDGNRPIPL